MLAEVNHKRHLKSKHYGRKHGSHHGKSKCCMACPFIGLAIVLVIHVVFQTKQHTAVKELEELTGEKRWGWCRKNTATGEWSMKCGDKKWGSGDWKGWKCG